jgi:hypothetical protein
MSLTGVPLILLALLATAAAGAGTVLLWHRSGAFRLPVRTLGLLMSEALAVLSIGLVVNRLEQFYPSWEALAGRTGTTAAAADREAGRLDTNLRGSAAATVSWRPDGLAGWRLAVPPSVVVPAGYVTRPTVSYPVVLSLLAPGPDVTAAVRAAKRQSAVGVVAVPTSGTTPAALLALFVDLQRDLRVTARGWALVDTPGQAALGRRLAAAAPGRFTAVVTAGPRRHHRALSLAAAEGWATGQTSLPLAAPLQLPSAARYPLRAAAPVGVAHPRRSAS